jgi:ribonuclease HII
MQSYYFEDLLEVGIDEVARGCLAGPVYTSAVVWPKELDPELDMMITKDSKKYSKRRRLILKDYIEEYAIDFSVTYEDNNVIDDINILNATLKSMHNSLDKLNMDVDHILVDGTSFKNYYNTNKELIPNTCIINGDAKYVPIACASILAKVYHDEYIKKICEENSEYKKYDWDNNMCYGTAKHLNAIRKHGITDLHRKTFGICKEY